MFDPNYGDDLFDFSLWSHSSLEPTLSSLHSYIHRVHKIVKKVAAGPFSKKRESRSAIALGSICILILLHTLVATDSSDVGNADDMALHQLLVSELPNLEPGEVAVSTSHSVMDMESLLNESSQSLPAATGNTLMQYARDTASRVCDEEEQKNKLILVKVPGEDASVYFSLANNSVEQAIQGGFLFGCPKPQEKGQPQQQSLHLPSSQVLSNGRVAERKYLSTRTFLPSSSLKVSVWIAFCNVALATLITVIVRWCSTQTILELKENVSRLKESAREVRPQLMRRISRQPPEHTEKTEPKDASAVKPPLATVPFESVMQKKTTAVDSTAAAVRTEKAEQKRNTPSEPTSATKPTEISRKSNDEVVRLGVDNQLRLYNLETQLGDAARAVDVRRQIVAGKVHRKSETSTFDPCGLPYEHYDYGRVMGACCENVIGYLPVPVGVAGPLNIDGKQVFLPMATTEGALVASTNRGCTAINASGGVTSHIQGDGMTRGPCVRFPNLERAGAAKHWLDSDIGFRTVEAAFNSTSRFGRLQSIKSVIAGSDVFIRFKARTGDAMGMNMMSKGVERALMSIGEAGFHDLTIVSLSGNYCTDKKAAAVNWIDGRGKSVAAQATIKAETLKKVLKVDVDAIVELNSSKNLVGSCLAGSIGGFNAHAANMVAAMFLATGQDIAQVVESSSCLTTMRKVDGDLQISVSMPSIEVGTVGGGTVLEAQGTMLDLLGVRGAHKETPGGNAQQLARTVAAGVLAGELSLCSALAAGSLVKSHMVLNRK